MALSSDGMALTVSTSPAGSPASATAPASSSPIASSGLNASTGLSFDQFTKNLANFGYKAPSASSAVATAVGNQGSTAPSVIPAATVGGTTSVASSLPATNPQNVSHDVVGTNAPVVPPGSQGAQGAQGNQAAPAGTQGPQGVQSAREQALAGIRADVATLGTQGTVTAGLQDQFGLPQKQQDAVSTYNAYNQAKLASDQQIASIYNTPGISRDAANQRAAEIGRVNNANLANLAVVANMAQGNLTAAQSIIQSKLDAQFAPIKTHIEALQSYITAQNNNLSDSEKAILNANLTVQTNTASSLLDAKKTAYTTAIQYGINDPAVFTAIDSATTTGGVFGSLNGAINPNGGTITTAPNVNGFNLTSYAPNDPDYTSKVNATSTAIGSVTSPAQANAAISKLAPNSPITGAMVVAASAASGVDPNTLISVMQQESQIGTTGAGVANNNPGNVKFIGQPGATKGPAATDGGNFAKFDTLQNGVNAMATSIAAKKIDPKQIISTSNASTAATGAQGMPTQTGQDFATLKASAPPIVSSALYQLQSSGSAFIDLGKIPAASQTMASAFARQHGIPLLDSGQADQARTTDEAIRNIVNTIAPAWAEIAPNNAGSRFLNHIALPFSAIGNTDFYAANKAFASNRESLAQQIKALSGSSPKLGLIGTAESALPNNAGYDTLTGSGGVDTYKVGAAKLNRTLQLLNESLASFVPGGAQIPPVLTTKENANGDAIGSTVTKNGVQYKVNVFGNYDPVK